MNKLILVLLLFLFACESQKLPEGSFELEFDESVWKSSMALKLGKNQITLRQKMLGNLINSTV